MQRRPTLSGIERRRLRRRHRVDRRLTGCLPRRRQAEDAEGIQQRNEMEEMKEDVDEEKEE